MQCDQMVRLDGFLNIWPTMASIVLFSSFSSKNLQKYRRLQWDSNSDHQIEVEHADHLTTLLRQDSWFVQYLIDTSVLSMSKKIGLSILTQ